MDIAHNEAFGRWLARGIQALQMRHYATAAWHLQRAAQVARRCNCGATAQRALRLAAVARLGEGESDLALALLVEARAEHPEIPMACEVYAHMLRRMANDGFSARELSALRDQVLPHAA